MTLTEALATLPRQLGKAPIVTALGLLGVTLGAICAAAGLIFGFTVPPEGNLWETATFDGAVGIFLLTQAALVPEAGFSERGRRRWALILVPLALYAYGIETVQAFRGLDPRISEVATNLDVVLGGIFFLDALAIMVMFIVLAIGFFRSEPTLLRVAVRYGAAASMIGFGVGIWMSLVPPTGRFVPEAGNLLFIHAVGFHGLQAVPLVALFLAWGEVDDGRARRLVHYAGLAWLVACLAILWQSLSGRPVLEVSLGPALAMAMLAAWALVAGAAFSAWRREAVLVA